MVCILSKPLLLLSKSMGKQNPHCFTQRETMKSGLMWAGGKLKLRGLEEIVIRLKLPPAGSEVRYTFVVAIK